MANSVQTTKAYIVRSLFTAGIMLAILTLSCSSDDGNGGNGDDGGTSSPSVGGSGEYAVTLSIKTITPTSVTVLKPGNFCQKDGTLKIGGDEYETNYTINDGILSLNSSEYGDQGAEFSGNSNSLIGTWTSSSLQVVWFQGIGYSNVQKAVFTQTSLTLTRCLEAIGYEDTQENDNGSITKTKNLDCITREYTYTKGNETVKRMRYYSTPTKNIYTYNGKTCTLTQAQPSQAQEIAACTAAYNKAKSEGLPAGSMICDCTHSSMGCSGDGMNGDGSEAVCNYYRETFNGNKSLLDCFNNYNFPQWFMDG